MDADAETLGAAMTAKIARAENQLLGGRRYYGMHRKTITYPARSRRRSAPDGDAESHVDPESESRSLSNPVGGSSPSAV